MLPALRKFVFVPATGQIIARTFSGDATNDDEEKNERKNELVVKSKETAETQPAKPKGTESKSGPAAPQPEKPKGELKVTNGDEGEDLEEGCEDDGDDVDDELAALNELEKGKDGKRKGAGKAKGAPKKKPKKT